MFWHVSITHCAYQQATLKKRRNIYTLYISSKSIPKHHTIELKLPSLNRTQPHSPARLTQSLVQSAVSIAVGTAVLQACVVIHAAPAVIRALLVILSTTVVRCAKTSALAGVNVAALVGHVADLVGAALTAASATASLVLDGSGRAAASLGGGYWW
jgi:hypothetical protein